MSKLSTLRDEFARLQKEKAEREKVLTETNKAIMAIQPKLVECMENDGLQSFNVPELGTFYLKDNMNVKQVDKIALYADIKKRKLGSLIKESINANSLKKLIKDMLKENKPLLKGVELSTFKTVVLMNAGKEDSEE